MSNQDALASRQLALFQALLPGVRSLRLLVPEAAAPAADTATLVIPLASDSGARLGQLHLALAVPDATAGQRLAPAVECLRQELAAADAAARATELRLLRLANELDIDFSDDPHLDKALAAAARRASVDVAWLHAPRCRLTAQAATREPVDAGVARELERLEARVTQLTGQLRRPLAINGQGARADRSAECRLLIVPLFIGRGRHAAWLVLLSPLHAPAVGGWQMLPALTLGQALARRLEVDLDRRTGLYNRGGLETAMRRLPGKGPASLVLIDIDRLHAINQMHGLAAGDEAIVSLAGLLGPPLLPANALAARVTGGTFAILLLGLELEAAAGVAMAIQTAAEAIHPGGGKDGTSLTVSGGVAEMHSLRDAFDKVAVDADFVLKLAKERGRSRVELHVAENSSIIRRHGEVVAAADLREALRTRRAVLFAQQIVSLTDRAPVGFELLLRMLDTQGNLIPPAEFIAAAQRFQLLPALDRYVVEQAFAALAPQRALLARLSCTMSINVSGQSITDEAFVDHFIAQLRASKVPPGLIIVEVTEQAAVTNLALAEKMMRRLRDVGCGIALDDFGTGANSLAYLRSLPVSRIKIDGSFVRDLMSNPRSEAALRGILQLARSFRLDTVAEYVENEALATKLRALGVDKGQGHLFGRPAALEEALRALADGEAPALRDLLGIG